VEQAIESVPALANIFSGVKRIVCKIIPINTGDFSTTVSMNSVSTLKEVIARVEKLFSKKIDEVVINEKLVSVTQENLETILLPSIQSEEGPVVLKVFFQEQKGKKHPDQDTNMKAKKNKYANKSKLKYFLVGLCRLQ